MKKKKKYVKVKLTPIMLKHIMLGLDDVDAWCECYKELVHDLWIYLDFFTGQGYPKLYKKQIKNKLLSFHGEDSNYDN